MPEGDLSFQDLGSFLLWEKSMKIMKEIEAIRVVV